MTYEKQNFKDGDVLKAEHLNHMEDGIVNAGGVTVVDFTMDAKGNVYASKTVEEISGILKSGGIVFGALNNIRLTGECLYDDGVQFYGFLMNFSADGTLRSCDLGVFVGTNDDKWSLTQGSILSVIPQ